MQRPNPECTILNHPNQINLYYSRSIPSKKVYVDGWLHRMTAMDKTD